MTTCCDILEKTQEKTTMRLLIYAIKRDILLGKSFYESIRNHTKYFNYFICQLIHIGEQSGTLDLILKRIVSHQEKIISQKHWFKQILFYPTILLVTALSITLLMFLFVIPQFEELFKGVPVKLPFLTQVIFYFSWLIRTYGLLLVGALTFIIGFSYRNASHAFKQMMSHLPLLKQSFNKIRLASFARNLATTLSAGLPMTNALKLATNACDHDEFSTAIEQLRNQLNAGLSLHHGMQQIALFPPFMVQMVKIGEESGTLAAMLTHVAEFFESDMEEFFHTVSRLLEPLIMVVLGVLIGGMVIGMYLPIFKLGNAF